MSDAKAKRDAIKAAGGSEYEALLAKERAARAEYRRRHPESIKAAQRERDRTQPRHVRRGMRETICHRARVRARKRGLDATIKASDLHWPTHCPVLGIKLDYSPRGQRTSNNPANPTLDRWDNTKGYVPGNVCVISMRANTLKNDATWQELQAIVLYARDGLRVVA